MRHGVVAASVIDSHAHIRGDAPCAPGDSGGGCFSAKRRRLLAVGVGMNEGECMSALLPAAAVLVHLPPPPPGEDDAEAAAAGVVEEAVAAAAAAAPPR